MQVVNRCANSPPGLEWQVRRSLRWISQADLEGLALIRLEDEMPEVFGGAAEWAGRVRAAGEAAHVAGWYSPPKADVPAYIMLYVRQVYAAVPSWLWWSTVPTLRILRTLAHEVAHHLVATRKYVFRPGENLEDEESLARCYAAHALERATARWSYKLGRWSLKEIAGWYYAFGNLYWREKKYSTAAAYFFKAWDLDPEHNEAAYWYWRAKDMLSSGQNGNP
jgi:tetratricopeptide (TPR) repeat protein